MFAAPLPLPRPKIEITIRERKRKREVLLQATEKLLAAVQKKVLRKRKPLRGKDAIGIEVGKVVNRKKVAKHFALTIADDSFVYARKAEKIRREAALDGLYVIRSSVAAERMTDAELVANYKNLEMVERAFRSLKSLDINVRPIHHRLEGRVRAHIFICLLAYYVEQTMRKMLAPLLFVDEEKEEPSAMADAGKAAGGVVRGASRSASACRKDSERKSADGAFGVASFRDILGALSSITRVEVCVLDHARGRFEATSRASAYQRRILELLGVGLGL